MELLIGVLLLWFGWWLFKSLKQKNAIKNWDEKLIENTKIAKEFGWKIEDIDRTVNEHLKIEMGTVMPISDDYLPLWKVDLSTKLTMHLSRNSAMLFADNQFCEFSDLNPSGTRTIDKFDIVEIQKMKLDILKIVTQKLEAIGAIECR